MSGKHVPFSIITATFNAQKYIKRCYFSLKAQTIKDWEWLIVDDASEDQTAEVVMELRDDRIRYIRLDSNIGRGPARNLALSKARGEWVVILDMDDMSFPERLEEARAAKQGGFEFMSSAVALIDDRYCVTGVRAAMTASFPPGFVHASLCGDRELVSKIGYTHYPRAQDQRLLLTLAATKLGKFHDQPLYIYHESAHVSPFDALRGKYYTALSVNRLLQEGILTKRLIARRYQIECFARAAVIGLVAVFPGLYQKSIAYRAATKRGADLLNGKQQEFIQECSRLFPM
jgi:glycosyltransferase involved in cell wall biosynthesis